MSFVSYIYRGLDQLFIVPLRLHLHAGLKQLTITPYKMGASREP